MANEYIHTYIHTYELISKEWKISFCRQGRLNHYKYLNIVCSYTIWLLTAFPRINTSNIQQIICVDTRFGTVMYLTFYSWQKNKMRKEAFQSRLMATSIGFSSLIGITYLIICSIVSFFWLYFYSSIQYEDN